MRPGSSRAISTAKKPKVIVVIVTDTDGKPKPLCTVGGSGMWIRWARPVVRTRPKASAATQCAAAIQRRRHSSQPSASTAAGTSTSQSPIEARPAISRSASGFRSSYMAWNTDRSSASGSPRIHTVPSSANQAQPIASRQAARIASEADSGRFGSISAAA